MKFKLIATLLATGAIASGSISAIVSVAKAETQVRFICSQSFDQQKNTRLPTTFAWTTRGKIAVVRWAKNLGNYSPQQRCQAISPRFQEAYDNGTLNLMTNGRMNGSPVICTASEYGGSCRTVLMTLRSDKESLPILNELKDIFASRQVGPVVHSSGTPQIYYGSNIDEFLRNAPVEQE